MLILPLPARHDWTRPPLATILIMILCLIAFLMQGSDPKRSAEAWRFYQQSGTAQREMTAYLADLEQRGKTSRAGEVRRQAAARDPAAAFLAMERDADFMQRLRSNRVITASHADFATWRSNRTRFEALRARIVTERFSLNGHDPSLASLITHMFLHGDIMHLSGNMAVLFVVGYTVEAALGPLGFLGLYLIGGLGAALPDLLVPATAYSYSLGASGAISAVMAAYLVLFGRRRIDFFYWLFFVFGTARWPALAILPVWLANELLQNFVFDRGGHVNYMAHFAGLLSGALLIGAYRWRRQGQSAALVHRQDADQARLAQQRKAEQLVADMQFGPAALAYRKLLAEYPPAEPRIVEEYLRIARLARQPELLTDAQRQLLKAAADQPRSVDPALLAEALDAMPRALPKLTAAQWEGIAGRLIVSGQLDSAERLLLRLMSHPDSRSAAARQAERLADAFIAIGDTERAALMRRLSGSRLAATAAPAE